MSRGLEEGGEERDGGWVGVEAPCFPLPHCWIKKAALLYTRVRNVLCNANL